MMQQNPIPLPAAACPDNNDVHQVALLAHLYQMPPVAALQLRLHHEDAHSLTLAAPLSAHINDKGCAFGGSLVSLLTLSGWALVQLQLQRAGLSADIFVAESQVKYRKPLYADLYATAQLAEGQTWDVFMQTLQSKGRARVYVQAQVALPEGDIATSIVSSYAAILR